MQVKFRHDPLAICFNGLGAQRESLGNLFIAVSLPYEFQGLNFPRCECYTRATVYLRLASQPRSGPYFSLRSSEILLTQESRVCEQIIYCQTGLRVRIV